MQPQIVFSIITTLGMVVSLTIAVASFVRSGKKDDRAATDARIDERIQLQIGEDLAVMKSQLLQLVTSVAGSNARDVALVKGAVEATAGAIKDAARAMVSIDTRRTSAGEPRLPV